MSSFMHMMDARVTPTTLIRSKLEGLQFRELEPIDREVPLEQYDYSQNPCSQGFLGSPDFITPQEACFAVDYDREGQENKGPRSPVVLSPQRGKRPRREVMGLGLGSQEDPLCSQQSIPQMSQDDGAVRRAARSPSPGPEVWSNRFLSALTPSPRGVYSPPGAAPSVQRVLRSMQKPPRPSTGVAARATRSRMALLRSQVASPPQFQNPFLGPAPAEASSDGARPSDGDPSSAAAGPSGASHGAAPVPQNVGAGVGRFRGDFKELSVLGQGSFCKVYKCRHRLDGCLYAVKRSKQKLLAAGERRAALREVQTLAACGPHPNIVAYHSAWFEDDMMYIQLEACDASLPAAVEALGAAAPAALEAVALAVARDVGAALAHVHSRGLAHLDVKPENILVRSAPGAAAAAAAPAGWQCKLGDFGLAAPLGGGFPGSEGDCRYMAPELLQGRADMLEKADVWALGAALLEVLSGRPLPASGPQYQALRKGRLPLLPGVRVSVQALLQRMLAEDPAQRPTAAEVLQAPVLAGAGGRG